MTDKAVVKIFKLDPLAAFLIMLNVIVFGLLIIRFVFAFVTLASLSPSMQLVGFILSVLIFILYPQAVERVIVRAATALAVIP